MISIDGVEYTEDDLNNEQKYLIAQVQDIDAKLRNLQFQADQLTAAKNVFSNQLVSSVKDVEESIEE